ncbi:30S ribosomal protein S5 [Candidatus Wolfebacteria bacterium RIFCSPHIGHO2_01_FULL_48_22]|uniref:Small ribosomal subunit protein uS5 n=2 Tax=Candidatus Wolfeibacteriota TaxID=1752735 RepID=A0A1F8DQN6_9BACT|nr:MAG: 30S ribosomal protein S5 [Candidatus Wolfebacteria bacterium RIFCSPHIGHO2_01_FULL_48_22]OGM91975.1 MAG: 30S ribosomal protein S5 [Candidatus Wolfebacteria bacterium RIFCSPLOWO2_01_FULL_47_17b]
MEQRRQHRAKRPEIKSEYKEKTIDIRRVTRVVKGGKRFSFRTTIVLGNEKGLVGIGMGKAADVAKSIEKARNQAKKKLFKVPMKDTTIAHETLAKSSAARVLLKPAKKGSGLKAGGAVRTVLLMAGVRDATAKCIGRTKNKLTNAFATIEALKSIKS